MERFIFQQLIDWKTSPRRKPLILQGARQVGKTYVLSEFAKKNYNNSIVLNFDDQPGLKRFFEQDLEPERIIKDLAIQFNVIVEPEKTLIIFDEIQESPNALASLKYFHEKANNYHVCAAGSLLGVKLAHTKGFPVGQVNFLQMWPMTFKEFLVATGNMRYKDMLESIDKIEPLPEPFHQTLLQLLKKYFFIGGMPEVVASYIKYEDLNICRGIQKEILKTYQLDFSKYTTAAQAMRIAQVWESIPSQLAKENKKFLYTVIRKSARAREYEEALQWLVEAGVIYKIYNITVPRLPLKAYADIESFKLYSLDVGVLNAHANLKPSLLVDGNTLFQEYKGSLAENYVTQELMQIFEENYYWTSYGKAELDFIIDIENNIYPIEVKSGLSQRKKSLMVYDENYHPKMLIRASINNLKLDGKLLNLPLYFVSEIPRLVGMALNNILDE